MNHPLNAFGMRFIPPPQILAQRRQRVVIGVRCQEL